MRSQVRPDGQVAVQPDGGVWDRDQAAAAIALASGARVVTQVADGSAELGVLHNRAVTSLARALGAQVMAQNVVCTAGP